MLDVKNVYSGPLEGRTAKVVFVLLVLFAVLVAILVCSDSLGLATSTRHLVLSVFVTITACGWFAFTGSEGEDKFFRVSVISLLIVSLLVAMTQPDARFAFWLTFLLILSTAILGALENKKDFWENLLPSLYVVWIVAGVFITLGNTSYFPYAKPIKEFSKIHPLLEIRFLISIILFALSVVYAVNKAFRERKPDIPLVQEPALRDISVGILAVFRPFVQVLQVILNVLLGIGINIANFIWLGIAKFAVYVARTGRNLGNHFLNLLLNGKIWKVIIRTLFSFVLALCFTGAILPMMSRFIDYYLRNVYPFYSIHVGNLVSLVKVGGLTLSTFLCIFLIHSLWQPKKSLAEIRDQGSLGLAFIFVAFALSGGIMYSIAHFREIIKINIIGFSSLGLFSFIALVFLIAGLLFVIKREIQEGRRVLNKEAEPSVLSKHSKQTALVSNENRWILAVLSSILFVGSVIILFPRLPNVQSKDKSQSNTTEAPFATIDTSQLPNQRAILEINRSSEPIAAKISENMKKDSARFRPQLAIKAPLTKRASTAMNLSKKAEETKQRIVRDRSHLPEVIESTSETTKVQRSSPSTYPPDDSVKSNDETKPQVKVDSSKSKSLFSRGFVNKAVSPPLYLRSVGTVLSNDAVQNMLASRDFYDRTRNSNGKGIAHNYRRETLANEETIVLDQATRLMWQQSGPSNRMNYTDAKNYVRRLSDQRFAGYSNWRLPTLEEAMSLMETEKKNGNLYIDPVFGQEQILIWTADEEEAGTVWVVIFSSGTCRSIPIEIDDFYFVRAVR